MWCGGVGSFEPSVCVIDRPCKDWDAMFARTWKAKYASTKRWTVGLSPITTSFTTGFTATLDEPLLPAALSAASAPEKSLFLRSLWPWSLSDRSTASSAASHKCSKMSTSSGKMSVGT